MEEGAETKGKILMNVDDSALKILSVYEGDEYEKKEVKVLCNNKVEDALAFVWANEQHLLESGLGILKIFKKTGCDLLQCCCSRVNS